MNHHALPIDALLPAITTSLSNHPRLILEAPPGAGKTTQVPLALLDAPWLNGRSIILWNHAGSQHTMRHCSWPANAVKRSVGLSAITSGLKVKSLHAPAFTS